MSGGGDVAVSPVGSGIVDFVRRGVSAGRVVGEPVQAGGATVVPVAWVMGGGGAGSGGAQEPGSGGGYGLLALPVGAYVVDADGATRFEPVVDRNLAVITGTVITLASLRLARNIVREVFGFLRDR